MLDFLICSFPVDCAQQGGREGGRQKITHAYPYPSLALEGGPILSEADCF